MTTTFNTDQKSELQVFTEKMAHDIHNAVYNLQDLQDIQRHTNLQFLI